MAAPLLALVLALAQRRADQYTLGYYQDTFVIRNGAKKETLTRVAPEPSKKLFVSFRRGSRWAVWDERGLTTRDGAWVSSDRLEAVSVSPRAMPRAEIVKTLALIKEGKRSRAASALSGARRVGGNVYFLARWDDKEGKPWLEALMVVDLRLAKPKPRLLGSFKGLTLSKGAIDDRLDLVSGGPGAVVRTADGWGVARYDALGKDFEFHREGDELLELEADGRIVHRSAYGTTLVGKRSVDGRVEPWMEVRGPAEFVPGEGAILVKLSDRLRNAETGAEIKTARDAGVRRAKAGILVFWPADAPRSARLYEPTRFEERARWELGAK